MKKAIKLFFVMFISVSLLTGCGESEIDYINAENPESFVKESFEDYYKKEIEVIEAVEKEDKKDNKTTIMKVRLKDEEDFTFKSCAYWDITAAIPKRYYTTVNNYENIYAEKILKKYFESWKWGTLIFEQKNTKYTDNCELEKTSATLEVKEIDKIDELAKLLIEIIDKKEIYAININIKYEDEEITLLLNEELNEKIILEKLSKLKKS